jgi:hypothetical protein
MNFRCYDCKAVYSEKEIVVLNSVKDSKVLFVCKTCLAKPKAPQTDKKEDVKGKLSSIFEVIGGSQ